MTIKVPLGNGRVALLSEEDKALASLSWYAHRGDTRQDGSHFYYAAHRFHVGDNKYEREWMHRLVMEAILGRKIKPRVEIPDHINGDKLDNRRENLRLANKSQNEANKGKSRGKSKFKGVSLMKTGKYRASISKDKKFYSLGTYPGTPEGEKQAAKAYNDKALELYGEFAQLNKLD